MVFLTRIWTTNNNWQSWKKIYTKNTKTKRLKGGVSIDDLKYKYKIITSKKTYPIKFRQNVLTSTFVNNVSMLTNSNSDAWQIVFASEKFNGLPLIVYSLFGPPILTDGDGLGTIVSQIQHAMAILILLLLIEISRSKS